LHVPRSSSRKYRETSGELAKTKRELEEALARVHALQEARDARDADARNAHDVDADFSDAAAGGAGGASSSSSAGTGAALDGHDAAAAVKVSSPFSLAISVLLSFTGFYPVFFWFRRLISCLLSLLYHQYQGNWKEISLFYRVFV